MKKIPSIQVPVPAAIAVAGLAVLGVPIVVKFGHYFKDCFMAGYNFAKLAGREPDKFERILLAQQVTNRHFGR